MDSNKGNIRYQQKYYKALQAQARYVRSHPTSPIPLRKEGSASVEAALVLPFFLCALCTVCIIAQFLLAEASIYHSLIQTVRVYARQESILDSRKRSGNQTVNSSDYNSRISKLGGMLETKMILMKYMEKEEVSPSYVMGGRSGILLLTSSDQNYVNVKAQYMLKVPLPFFKYLIMRRTMSLRCRKFNGYYPHNANEEGDGDGASCVYVAQYGEVYHTNPTCYHLMVCISDPSQVQYYMRSSSFRKCTKCIHKGEDPKQIYTTKDGDCYHSTLSCSGLKRSVRVTNINQIGGLRMCSECAKKQN